MGIPADLIPPINQPPQKSYRDWNGVVGNPQNAWVVSEPGIYYQAAYVELLSRYAR
jgi:endoglucanase